MSKNAAQGGRGGKEKGGFVLGLIVGLLVGLAVALGVALYVTKAPVPFVNKLPQRTAEQDGEEAKRNQNWDPNAPLASKGAKQAASGVVSAPPAPAPTPAPVTAPAAAEAKPAKVETKAAAASAPAAPQAGDTFIYFVQAGAYTRMEDAEQQRAKLALSGFVAKVTEKEQSGRTVYRVRSGPFESREEADSQQQKLQSAGVEANLVRVQR